MDPWEKNCFGFFFTEPHLQHIKIPLQHWIQVTFANYAAAHGNTRSLTHWVRPGIESASSQRQRQVLNHLNLKGNSIFGVFCLFVFVFLLFVMLLSRALGFYQSMEIDKPERKTSDKALLATCWLIWIFLDPVGCRLYAALSFLSFFFFCFLGPHLGHMEVPRLGVESEL